MFSFLFFLQSESSSQEENSVKSSAAAIKSLSLSPREDLLVALTSDLLLYSFAMKKKESSVQKRNIFSILLYPFHSDSIEGLDLCHRKPLIVTCSRDHTIRIWNYKTFRMELAKVSCLVIYSDAQCQLSVVPRGDIQCGNPPSGSLHCCGLR